MVNTEEVSQVTKAKNEGRVNAGKRLAEWNRKSKEDLIKNKNQVNPSENQVNPSENQVLSSTSSSTIILGIFVLSLVSYIIYDKTSIKKTALRSEAVATKTERAHHLDVFRMN